MRTRHRLSISLSAENEGIARKNACAEQLNVSNYVERLIWLDDLRRTRRTDPARRRKYDHARTTQANGN